MSKKVFPNYFLNSLHSFEENLMAEVHCKNYTTLYSITWTAVLKSSSVLFLCFTQHITRKSLHSQIYIQMLQRHEMDPSIFGIKIYAKPEPWHYRSLAYGDLGISAMEQVFNKSVYVQRPSFDYSCIVWPSFFSLLLFVHFDKISQLYIKIIKIYHRHMIPKTTAI